MSYRPLSFLLLLAVVGVPRDCLALSVQLNSPAISFAKSHTQFAKPVESVLSDQRAGFKTGLHSLWPPEWSTILVFDSDSVALCDTLDRLAKIKGLRLRVTFSKDLSKETGSALPAGTWWVKYRHTEPDLLTIRVNLASAQIDPETLRIGPFIGASTDDVGDQKGAELRSSQHHDLADGMYTMSETGEGTRAERCDGGTVILGRNWTDRFGAVTLVSVSNDNRRFVLNLKGAGPVDPAAQNGQKALVIAGVCMPIYSQSDRHPDGTLDVSAQLVGGEAARRIASTLKIDPRMRKHPGHRLLVHWQTDKPSYRPGEPILARMEIKNVGDGPVSFMAGGQQRGDRDNQFRFLAYRSYGNGKAIPDTGNPENFGGKSSRPTLQPGETFTREVQLDKWFQFTAPDAYRVTGMYEIDLYSPAADIDTNFILWQDLPSADFTVRVEQLPEKTPENSPRAAPQPK